jgi:hypothetical protein
MLPSQQREQDIFSQQSSSVEKPSQSSGRAKRFLNMVVAILVVGVIIGTAFMLFSNRVVNLSHDISTGEPVGPIRTPVLVQSQNGGLEASLRITSGPYFLSELLGVQITLTNHSNKSFLLDGFASDINYCDGVFRVTSVGGDEPHYNFPINIEYMSCPGAQTQLDVGKTLMVLGYVPLTKSGQVTITSEARFLSVAKDTTGHELITRGNGPLDGHWPVIHILVNAKIPIDRTLSVQQQGSQITVDAPTAIQSHVVYFYSVSCVAQIGTNGKWTLVTTQTLQQPECSGANKHWSFAVSAPGYAIASGEISTS